MGIKDRETARARQAVTGMFSTAKTDSVLSEDNVSIEQVFDLKEEVKDVPINAPKRRGRPTVNRETKKRYTLTLLPSIYEAASAKAYEQGKSVSELVEEFLSEYTK